MDDGMDDGNAAIADIAALQNMSSVEFSVNTTVSIIHQSVRPSLPRLSG